MPGQRDLFDKDDLPQEVHSESHPGAAATNSGIHDAVEAIGGGVTPAATTAPRDEAARAERPPGPSATTVSLAERTVYLVDAHSLIFQVFHALPEMASPHGEPVGAVFGFVRDMLYLIEEKKPDFLFCAFDLPGPTFRHQQYEDYKRDREEMPDPLRPQIVRIRQAIQALGIPELSYPGYEADDVLATVAKIVDQHGGECYLVTGDKDCRQLITDHVRLYNIRKNEVFDAAALQATWGIRPDQVVDFQAIVGDSIDNVPGVPGIGPKGAQQLLEQFETLENIFANLDKISGKKKLEGLRNHHQQALMSRDLVRLVDDLPLEIDWGSAKQPRIDRAAAAQLFRELGFRTLTQKMESGTARAEDDGPAPPEWRTNYQTIVTLDQLQELVAKLSDMTCISLDTETTSMYPRQAQIVGYSFAWAAGEAAYVPVRVPPGEPRIDPDEALQLLKPLLENPKIKKAGQNLKYDMIVLRNVGVTLRGATFDTMIAGYLLEAGARNHSLDELAQRYLQHETIKITELIGSGKQQKRMDEVPLAQISPYASQDADVPLRLVHRLGPQLDRLGLRSLFEDLEIPLIEVLAEMEFHGIRVSTARLAELSAEYQRRLQALEQEIHQLAGHPFNIASPRQLATVLFDELGLSVVKKTKTGASTDAEVLEQLATLHPLPAKVVEYRQYAKLLGTYIDALPKLLYPETGRIHTSFNQVVAATGRLSSADPNLQNIPIRTREGREIRSAFLPAREDWVLLAADYSQIELRVLASFSRDATLMAAFSAGEDIHARVASEVNDVALSAVTPEMRRQAKAVNFGVIYGQSPFGLSKALGIDNDVAAAFITTYYERYSGIARFMNEVLDACRSNGFVTTVLGRRREIKGVRSATQRGDTRQRTLPERTAINTVIQGSAADLIKLAMLRVHRRLPTLGFPARLLLQIHDELVLEVPREHARELAEMVRHEMESIGHLDVPLKVDVKTGTNWAECEPLL